ncbi:hypothetical protein B0E47_07730 [Rhodanobacter sp. B05]|jgi:hypothetical protein|uniref:hypothetical protein n=1 Tax=Rhodanobacter sp. B05 TaxID=1945859 RepID=UPI000987130B|nr:hypothetical protein [Rhodanobacter sp. B05]OOG55759.1 hypothetical protein B0E47_07730 [Rhodanobacter sp. B05]
MHGFWSETNWRLDGDALLMPNGWRLPLRDVLQWRDDLMQGRHDLGGRWSGWRVRQQWLIAPGGSVRQHRIAEHVMRQHIRTADWDRQELGRRQLTLF